MPKARPNPPKSAVRIVVDDLMPDVMQLIMQAAKRGKPAVPARTRASTRRTRTSRPARSRAPE
jgi:hypothetical protein